jgi:hypothetical protein
VFHLVRAYVGVCMGDKEGRVDRGVSISSLSSLPFEWGGLGVGYMRCHGERVVLHNGLDWTQTHRVRLQLAHCALYPYMYIAYLGNLHRPAESA